MTPRGDADVLESNLRRQGPLLDILLKNRSGRGNIIWATDSYASEGKLFAPTKPILPKLVTGKYGTLIQPRAVKPKDEQKRRTKDKAEVFTPLEIVDQMNKAIDWAGRHKVVDRDNWQDYVKETKLEITCGEAPFIVSRYNPTSSSGKVITLINRVGFLDRKLRAVSKNCKDKDEWFKWVTEAYKASYGYEWQGDNLLIARENLLYSFYDYWRAKFDKSDKDLPPMEWRIKIATIISWNIWQMDGLKYVVPMSCRNMLLKTEVVDKNQLALPIVQKLQKTKLECEGCRLNNPFGHNGKYALVKDWTRGGRDGRIMRFVELLDNA